MKKVFYFLVFIPLLFLTGCNTEDCDHTHDNNYTCQRDPINKVLMLRIDRPNNKLKGAIEFIFDQQTDSFNIEILSASFDNFSTVSLIYRELNDTLFSGTRIPGGIGNMTYPETLYPAELLDTVTTDDVFYPLNGFDDIQYEEDSQYTYYYIWLEVQKYVKVRQYIQSNPTEKVKIYLYVPYEGQGDYTNTDWLIFIKN